MLIVFGVLRQLARYDALHILEKFYAPGPLIALSRLLWGRKRQIVSSLNPTADALVSMGPSFIKLGQALSIRPDIVGQDIAAELRQLQDSMSAFGGDEARNIIEQTFAKPISSLFSSFDDVPVAAASIAQVHYAKTIDGTAVAVKVVRPGIRAALQRDVRRLGRAARAIQFLRPETCRFQPNGVVERFAQWSNKELDLRLEAASCTELARCFSDIPWFKPPKIYWALTGRDVLTEEWIDGVRIDDHDKIRNFGLDPQVILMRSIEAFFLQVFEHGYFHGDIHPGNIFVTKEGVLRPMDFGIMGRIPMVRRQMLADMLIGFMTWDYPLVTDALVKMGFVRDLSLKEDITDALRIIIEPMLNSAMNGVSFAEILSEIFVLANRYDLQFDSDLLLLNKAMFQAEGTGRLLDSQVNVWAATEPHMEEWLMKHRGLAAQAKQVSGEVRQLLASFCARDQQNVQEQQSKWRTNKSYSRLWYVLSGILLGVCGMLLARFLMLLVIVSADYL